MKIFRLPFISSISRFHGAKQTPNAFRRCDSDSQRLVRLANEHAKGTMVIPAKVTEGREKIKILERFERPRERKPGVAVLAVNANLMRRRFLSPRYLSPPYFQSQFLRSHVFYNRHISVLFFFPPRRCNKSPETADPCSLIIYRETFSFPFMDNAIIYNQRYIRVLILYQ